MRRREFLTVFGGATAAWPLDARAQQTERIRRIGVLMGGGTGDEPEMQSSPRHSWKGCSNWVGPTAATCESSIAGPGEMRATSGKHAAELAALAPDVILTGGSAPMGPLQQATRTVPIVFTIVPDPVGAGFVESLARPGGNITGFMQGEYNLSGKWLELLKQIAPGVTRAAVLRDAAITAGIGQFAVIQSVAPSLGMDVSPVSLRDAGEIERAVTAFARAGNGGLILTSSALSNLHRELIVTLAARYKLPAVYSNRAHVTNGGLISYGADFIDLHRRAAGYVDRILKGEKPANLPVQAPTKYQLVINLKTAKALGLAVPPSVLARADEVIE